jgi:hypothetical protein
MLMNNKMRNRNSEAGSARIKLMAVLLALFLAGHAGYNYIPVAYQGESFKQDMQTAVLQGMAVPNGIAPSDMVKGRIQRAIVANDIPADAVVQVKPTNGSVTAHVAYTKQVNMLPFGLYKYKYHFNNTASPTGFLLKDSASTK